MRACLLYVKLILDRWSVALDGVGSLTLNRVAIPGRGDLSHSICNSPVLVSDLDQTHSGFSSVPSGLDDIGLTSSDRVFFGCTNDDSFCADCSKTVYMRSDVKFYDITVRESL